MKPKSYELSFLESPNEMLQSLIELIKLNYFSDESTHLYGEVLKPSTATKDSDSQYVYTIATQIVDRELDADLFNELL
ncbi:MULTISPECIES: hypothetical protein [Vibrio]|uniref:hypothetical protein n=1 Tax=Vibrio TaxID=662 RepID=UPI00352EAB08